MNFLDKKRGLWAAPLTLALGLLVDATAFAQGNSVIVGTVRDAASKAPVPDVVVTITSPALQGEQIVVTDGSGQYRLPQLPPGDYTIRLEKETYKPSARSGVSVRVGSTIRVNIDLLPEAIKAEEIVVVGRPPTVDVGSTQLGAAVGSEFVSRVALIPPAGRGAATRSFESVAEIAPTVQTDTYGMSVSGTTSPENQYIVDGLSVNDAAFGILSSPLSVEFVKEVNVITGGYMPEYGRATGGVLDAVTKSGSNEFHGSIFAGISPGVLEGERAIIQREGQTILTDPKLESLRDFGVEFGGPIVKDKLWFFVGFSPSFSRYKMERYLNNRAYDLQSSDECPNPDFDPNDPMETDPEFVTCNIRVPRVNPDTGFTVVNEIPGTRKTFYADQQNFQYIGKLTYLVNQDHNVTLSVSGVQTTAGGNGSYAGTQSLNGTYEALATKQTQNSTNMVLKWASSFMNKNLLFDATLGWSHVTKANLPVDGSKLGSRDGLAGLALVQLRRATGALGFRNITEFENSPEISTACTPVDQYERADIQAIDPVSLNPCPVTQYNLGGPGFINEATLDRYQGKAVVTRLLTALGHHVIKAGVDIEIMNYDHLKAYTGTTIFRESLSGRTFQDFRRYGFLQGPDNPVILNSFEATSMSTTAGGFLQDSWSIMDKVTLNAGVRYDAQIMTGNDGKVGLSLPNQWSPRVGVIYDFTQQGRSKLFVNYARYYENVPLNIADRSFPGEKQIRTTRRSADCDPRTLEGQQSAGCTLLDDQGNFDYTNPNAFLAGGAYDPNQYWQITGGDKVAVDTEIKPQSSDELVVGGEYEIFPDGRLGLQYTKRYMNNVIEDMSRDDGATYFLGNPSQGIARDFPQATRDYDQVTLYFTKAFSNQWLAQASYTLAYLRGNYPGLFRPESGQLDPNINSDFDLISLLPNRSGPLPGDKTHQIKIYGAKDFTVAKWLNINVGATFKSTSGGPVSVLGGHIFYGPNEAFILPRGSYDRLPWVHTFDTNLGFAFRLSKESELQLGVSIFNLFNFQAATAVDQALTTDPVTPIPPDPATGRVADATDLPTKNAMTNKWECIPPSMGGTCRLTDDAGNPFDAEQINPNFNNPTQYQSPRQFRFNAKVTF